MPSLVRRSTPASLGAKRGLERRRMEQFEELWSSLYCTVRAGACHTLLPLCHPFRLSSYILLSFILVIYHANTHITYGTSLPLARTSLSWREPQPKRRTILRNMKHCFSRRGSVSCSSASRLLRSTGSPSMLSWSVGAATTWYMAVQLSRIVCVRALVRACICVCVFVAYLWLLWLLWLSWLSSL